MNSNLPSALNVGPYCQRVCFFLILQYILRAFLVHNIRGLKRTERQLLRQWLAVPRQHYDMYSTQIVCQLIIVHYYPSERTAIDSCGGEREQLSWWYIVPLSHLRGSSRVEYGSLFGRESDLTRSRYTQIRRDQDLFWSTVMLPWHCQSLTQ